jgi:hypothetical protein
MTGMLAQMTTATAVGPECSDAIKTNLAIIAQFSAPIDAAEDGKREAIEEAYWQLMRALRSRKSSRRRADLFFDLRCAFSLPTPPQRARLSNMSPRR